MTFAQAAPVESPWEQAKALCYASTSVRWIACRAALGREFQTWEFLTWSSARWREFCGLQGCRDSCALYDKLKGEVHSTYDRWLKLHVNEGVPAHWTTP
jgi:hypothetical protein